MKTQSDVATEKFLSGYNCAQSVLWSFSPALRFDPESALKIACGFGAGMARRQDICGAVTGGLMVLGLKFGRGERQDRTATDETYAKTQDLMCRFEARHGSCNCRQLLDGCDLTTEDGLRRFKEKDMLNHTCKACIQTVVGILEDMISPTKES
jgi:C_GCAxxG_C_C family probable redox protein